MVEQELITRIPLELFQVGTVGTIGAAVAANADGTYTGARATFNIFNKSTRTVILPRDSIIVNCTRRHEIVVYPPTTSTTVSINRLYIMTYQRNDADNGTILHLPQIVLQPGFQLIFDVYNRDVATAADITASTTLYIIETRIYNLFITKQKEILNKLIGLV